MASIHSIHYPGKLSGEDWAKVQSAAEISGLPIQAVEQMRPWLAGLTLVVVPMTKAGHDPNKGADEQFEESAKAGNKVIKTFETPERQLLFFSSLSEQAQIGFLVRNLDEIAAGPTYMDRMAGAWLAGDTGEMEAMMLNQKERGPELYDTLIVRRNLDWCSQIATIMKGAGTSFVAVGAAIWSAAKACRRFSPSAASL